MVLSNQAAGFPLFTPGQLAEYTGGGLAVKGRRNIERVVIDSRLVRKNDLFVPLPGSRVDGHSFLAEAVEKGAAAVLAGTRSDEGRSETLHSLLNDRAASLILVDNTLRALQDLARRHLQHVAPDLRLGITGSNGKTTTKEILGHILSLQAETAVNEGNLNSDVGLPLAAFMVTSKHRYAVFEMGMNHTGEIGELARMVHPDIALITNIGSAHIGLLGSRQAIAEEKKQIFSCFDGGQTAFVYEKEEFLPFLREGVKGKIILYGPESTPGYEGSQSLGLDGTVIHWEGLRIRFPLFGVHNLKNALSSISVSAVLGISKRKIKEGLEAVRPLFGRSQIIRGEITVVQDCYNANPDSVRQVLDFFRPLDWQGRKIIVLGSMKELGADSEEEHRRLGRVAAASGFDVLFLFGEEMASAAEALKQKGYSGRYEWTADFDRLRDRLDATLKRGDLLLLKGSRTLELERLAGAWQGRS
jgi:UDP-N-acetylmuramoyl-tripeptide--D-alanyl-D-alanine ligase